GGEEPLPAPRLYARPRRRRHCRGGARQHRGGRSQPGGTRPALAVTAGAGCDAAHGTAGHDTAIIAAATAARAPPTRSCPDWNPVTSTSMTQPPATAAHPLP